MKWVQNLEIPGTETEGHFRRRITWKKSTEQPMESGGKKPVDYDDHLLRRKKAIEEDGDVYNHIHFQKVPTVQSSSDQGVILKKPEDNLDKSWPVM